MSKKKDYQLPPWEEFQKMTNNEIFNNVQSVVIFAEPKLGMKGSNEAKKLWDHYKRDIKGLYSLLQFKMNKRRDELKDKKKKQQLSIWNFGSQNLSPG